MGDDGPRAIGAAGTGVPDRVLHVGHVSGPCHVERLTRRSRTEQPTPRM
jgi:hypothetical protein